MAEKTSPETTTSSSLASDSATGSKQNLLISLAVGAVVLLIFLMAYLYLKANTMGVNATSNVGNASLSSPIMSESQSSSGLHDRAAALASRLGADSAALAGMVVELNTRLETAEGELKGIRALYTSASRQVSQLEQEAEKARLSAAEVELLRGQLAEARAVLDLSKRRSETLMAKLAAAPDASTLANAKAMSDSYLAQLRDSQAKLGQLEPENAKLRAELAVTEIALVSTELFVEKLSQLPDNAKELYMELARLETVDRSELKKNYNLITQTLGCRVIDTVTFATGSSEIAPAKAASIRTAIAGAAPKSFFLVVGYASKTGNFDLNKSLSSNRARATATLIDGNKLPAQHVRGVFLGQTDRFSTDNVYDDQVCEIWEIPR